MEPAPLETESGTVERAPDGYLPTKPHARCQIADNGLRVDLLMIRSFKTIIERMDYLPQFVGGVFSQGLVSLSSLAINILMANFSSKEEYGIYVLFTSAIIMAGTIQNAVINTPLAVMYKNEQSLISEIISGLSTAQIVVLSAISAVILLALGLHYIIYKELFTIRIYGSAQMALLGYLFREYVRTITFCKLRIKNIVIMDFSYLLMASFGFFCIAVWGKIESASVLMAVAIASMGSGILGSRLLGININIRMHSARASLTTVWKYAKWSLVGVTAANLKNYGYLYLVSATLSLAAAADLSAIRILYMPFGLIIVSCQKYCISKGSSLLHQDSLSRISPFSVFTAIFLFGCWLLWSLILIFGADSIMALLYRDKYCDAAGLIPYWGMVYLGYLFYFVCDNELIVKRRFKESAYAGVISSGILIVMLYSFIDEFGARGALICLLGGDMLFCAMVLRWLFGKRV